MSDAKQLRSRLEPLREGLTEGDPGLLQVIGGGRVERVDQLDADWARLGVVLGQGILACLGPRDRRDDRKA